MPKPLKPGPGVKVTKDFLPQFRKDMETLAGLQVLVGFPEDNAKERKGNEQITNAALGWIHDNGAPEVGIPARPFMIPGIEREKDKIEAALVRSANTVLRPRKPNQGLRGDPKAGLNAAGLIAQRSIRATINEGIPPPLSEATLRARAARGRKGAQQELENRAQGKPASTILAKPLVDTGQMRNAVNYVIRKRK